MCCGFIFFGEIKCGYKDSFCYFGFYYGCCWRKCWGKNLIGDLRNWWKWNKRGRFKKRDYINGLF